MDIIGPRAIRRHSNYQVNSSFSLFFSELLPLFSDFLSITRLFESITGKVEPGMPEVSLPPFQIEYHNRTLSFTEVCTELGSGIIVVPLVAVLANVAIAKAFSESSKS